MLHTYLSLVLVILDFIFSHLQVSVVSVPCKYTSHQRKADQLKMSNLNTIIFIVKSPFIQMEQAIKIQYF
jgi:hypothetical protein